MPVHVTLRLRPSRTQFQVFFAYSDPALRSALLATGVVYDAAAQGYVVPADPEAVGRVQSTCQQRGWSLKFPPTTVLAPERPAPTPLDNVLSRYCQGIVLKRYSPKTLKNYRFAFQAFVKHHTPRVPLDLSHQEVLDYMALRIGEGISEAYQNLIINAIKFYYEAVEGKPRQYYALPRPKRPDLNPHVTCNAK